MIPFNKPFLTGKEAHYMYQAVYTGKLSGNGVFTKKCQAFFEQKYGFKKALMTTSCTDALEMAAILCDVKPGDEVIVPSYTFVSSALAFVRQGAKIVFADSCANNPNIDADKIESLITDKTKVIVPVHYAGVACDMDKIMEIAQKYNLGTLAVNGYQYNLYTLGIDFENPWWDQKYVSTYSLKDSNGNLNLYSVIGDWAISCFEAAHAIVYNKTVYDNAGIEDDIYQLVHHYYT